jgi:hypothetical protein
MSELNTIAEKSKSPTFSRHKWMDAAWLLLMLTLLAAFLLNNPGGSLCAQIGTDYRGYYSSAQIARQHGFARVYDDALQDEYQHALLVRCPGGKLEAGLRVSMPYLPVYVVLFLPLTALDITQSYLIFTLVNAAGLALYLVRFNKAMQAPLSGLRLVQWILCLPALASLYLGQMNLLLVIALGEFTLAMLRGQEKRGGLWLGLMLMKPHTLILLLPGLLAGRRWRALLGFGAGAAAVLGASLLLAGTQGVLESNRLALRFAGPLIQTAPTMMNWRGLALNLALILPDWIAWGLAVAGMILTAGVVLVLWLSRPGGSPSRWVLLILATYAATCAVAWHAHFYLLMPLIPLLACLDGQRRLPTGILAAWLLGPPLVYLLAYLINPQFVRNGFGMGMLVLDLLLLSWSTIRLKRSGEPEVRKID